MKTETKQFKASTQYTDWFGSVALDGADFKGVSTKFSDVLEEGERILGVDAYLHTDSDTRRPILVFVSIYTGDVKIDELGKKVDKKYPIVKKHTKEMTVEEFFRLFKRINIKVSRKNILEDKPIKIKTT